MQLHQHFPKWSLPCILLVLLYTVHKSDAVVSDAGVMKEFQDCYNNYMQHSLKDFVGHGLSWICDDPAIKKLRNGKYRPSTQSAATSGYVSRIVNKFTRNRNNRRFKRQADMPKCRRKEYRMLTDEERFRFHAAVNALKYDNATVSPNKYDALARLHTGLATNSAHGGANFLGWHRAYLIMFEIALQEIDINICLPYWDSSMDNELDEPSSSYVFSPDFLGGGAGNGALTDGPFAGWDTPEDGPLIRNTGNDGELFTLDAIGRILSREHTHEIVPPNSSPENDIEFHHGGVHVFLGGNMMQLETASFDPAFFLHHCFIDYLWELFRTKQRAIGRNPELDYPEDVGSPLHARNLSLGLNLGLTAADAYMDDMTFSYEYEPSPDCNSRRPECGSRYLRCDIQRGRCIPVDPNIAPPVEPTTVPLRPNPGPGPRPNPRPVPRPNPGPGPRPNPGPGTHPNPGPGPRPNPGPGPVPIPNPNKGCKNQIRPTQNNYCINGVCDTSNWVYTAVKVVSIRPPSFHGYDSYPVRNGQIMKNADIYQPSAYAETSRYISNTRGVPKSYEKCEDGNGIGQVYVQASGINYDGFYKESAIIDQRLATSISIAYVAVKDPKNGPVKALFRAFDSCGRICHTACKIPGTNDYQPCSGILNIEDVPGKPKQYSRTYGQAALNTWGYAKNEDCPSFQTDDITLTFYCDYRDRIPWTDPKAANVRRKPKPVQVEVLPEPAPNPNECKVDADCTIGVPCTGGKNKCSSYGETHKCLGTCNKYAVCNYGQYWTRSCPFDWSFNDQWHSCSSRKRCDVTPKKKPAPPKERVVAPPAPARSSYLNNLRGRFFGSRRRSFFG